MNIQKRGDRYQKRKGLKSDSRKQTQDLTLGESLHLNKVSNSKNSQGLRCASNKPGVTSHEELDMEPIEKDAWSVFENKANSDLSSSWPINFVLAPSILQSLTTPRGKQSLDRNRTNVPNKNNTRKHSPPNCREPKQSAISTQSQLDNNVRTPSPKTKHQGLSPRVFKSIQQSFETLEFDRPKSLPIPKQKVLKGFIRPASAKNYEAGRLDKEKSDQALDSPSPVAYTPVSSQENESLSMVDPGGNGLERKSQSPVAFCRGVSVDVPGSPTALTKARLRPSRKKPYQLPSLEDKAEILFFQDWFRNPSSVIVTGKWEIPVHGSIIRVKSPLLASRLRRSRRNAEYLLKKLNDRSTVPPTHRRRKIRILKSGNKLREVPINYFTIQKPPRAVFEFIKLFYPQCELDLYKLSKWSEVIAVQDLCSDYDVAGAAQVIKNCIEYLKDIIKDQSLDELLSCNYRTGNFLELKEEIADCIVERLIAGQVSAKDVEKFDVKKWKIIMTSKAWRSGRNDANYNQLAISSLEWIALNDTSISKNDLVRFLDCTSGFPGDLTATKYFIKAIKSDAVCSVFSITKRLRSELQIAFWRRITDYIFRLSDLGFVSS